MLENFEVLIHSSIRINKESVIYIDPYNITENYNDADIVFITHSHYDHFSIDDIYKVKKENTIFIVPVDVFSKLKDIDKEQIISVKPNMMGNIENIKFETISAYNTNKTFHPKGNNWLGYILTIEGIRYYIAGDTDITEENKKVKCDVAFIPVGGTYTMDYKEAADFVTIIKPKIAIPTHYGSIVGKKEDGENFIKLLDDDIKGCILIK